MLDAISSTVNQNHATTQHMLQDDHLATVNLCKPVLKNFAFKTLMSLAALLLPSLSAPNQLRLGFVDTTKLRVKIGSNYERWHQEP